MDPYACPRDNKSRPCPHRYYPPCYVNAPPEARATMHQSTCTKGHKCEVTRENN